MFKINKKKSCCFHQYKFINKEGKIWIGKCELCNKECTTDEGWSQFCPDCNKVSKTSCIACGCGHCLECGYRFSCMRKVFEQELTKISKEGIIWGN